ncbi:hypothetical protein FB451DRAFT_1275343, partial [Mycena latifolia]
MSAVPSFLSLSLLVILPSLRLSATLRRELSAFLFLRFRAFSCVWAAVSCVGGCVLLGSAASRAGTSDVPMPSSPHSVL